MDGIPGMDGFPEDAETCPQHGDDLRPHPHGGRTCPTCRQEDAETVQRFMKTLKRALSP